jgi:hypothetical protein
MLIGVFSDVHDNLQNLDALLEAFARDGIDTLLFLGDFCSPIPARRIGTFEGTVHCVFGNGDGDRFAMKSLSRDDFPALVLHGEYAELTMGRRRIAMTHYPFYARALARTGDYDAVFSGHTHEQHVEQFGRTLWVNPGEVLGWKGPPGYAVYDTETHRVELHTL